ncbi:MAG: late competence development ComFB family protein [Treponema sp.]|jgi:competence protein ComFB|nr:late competence development ComFB family protein [Treponema sp.]
MFTEIHNTVEDIIFAQVTEVCDSIEKDKKGEICTCRQCRIDTACYVLNRIRPHYISSNRGVIRIGQGTIAHQQEEAEIVSLIYEGIEQVNHNRRPFINHGVKNTDPKKITNTPVFNPPTIVGRIFNGLNFEPLSEARIELLRNGDLVAMKDASWQNPFDMVSNTEGTFTFWPTSIPAESVNTHKVFEYSLKIESPNLEPLTHFFKIPVTSEILLTGSYSMERSFKLPNLYMFPPGGVEDDF